MPNDSEIQFRIETHYPRIRRTALVLTGKCHDADDLAQGTFLQAIRSLSKFKGESSVGTWLYSILTNVYRKHVRAKQRYRSGLMSLLLRPFKQASCPVESFEEQEWIQGLWSAVAQLPQNQQEVMVLRYSEGLSNEEIAFVVDCPIGTVKSRLHYAVISLQGQFAESEQELDSCSSRRNKITEEKSYGG